MFKSLQIKIILIIMLVGIVMLAGFEYLMITEMKTLDITENIIAKNQQIAAISLIAYLVISFIIILFATKTVSKPINKLIESAKQIASGQDIVIEDRKEEKSKTDINHFLDLMETKYNLFDTDETEGKLREQLTQFGYEGKMTKNQMAEYMQSLLPENKVINEEYYNGVERQYIRKSALGWDYDEIREKEKTALTMYYKGEYSDNSLEKELSELINGMSADRENTLRKIDILILF